LNQALRVAIEPTTSVAERGIDVESIPIIEDIVLGTSRAVFTDNTVAGFKGVQDAPSVVVSAGMHVVVRKVQEHKVVV
jgi:hypothetical protein